MPANRTYRIRAFIVIAIMLAGTIAVAEVPKTFTYQGRLTDGSGTPVTNGNYSIVFRMYTVETGGSAFWASDRMTVSVVDGLFSVKLGPFPTSVFSEDSSRWLGITVGGDDEISPRTQLQAVPYAFYADEAGMSRPIMWSGGCSSHGQVTGFTRYCTDVEDFNTADGYLTVMENGTFTVETAGFYRINAWSLNLSSMSASVSVRKNGANIHESSFNTQDDWITLSADVTWYFDVGDVLDVWYYSNSGDYNYYSYDGSCCYSRLQVTYVGP
ncbi:MAG: hypothetical protein JW763_00505 [candidate division Zixibacteria bacterium]|nr:hypothetical protein [candidate division Zixibacteria bacterium]